ncbi:MAG: ABC transporter ATP-binding protein [Pseudomonadota bacterium]
MRPIMDAFPDFGDSVMSRLVVLGFLLAIFTGGAAMIRVGLARAINALAIGLGLDLTGRLLDVALHRRYRDHVDRHSSELIGAIQKTDEIVYYIVLALLQGMSAAIIGVTIIAALLFISPVITAVAGIIFASAYWLLSKTTRPLLRKHSAVAAQMQTQRVKIVQEASGGMRDIIIGQTQKVFADAYRFADQKFRHAFALSLFLAQLARPLIEYLGILLIIGLAIYFAMQPGGLVAAIPVLGSLALGAQRLLPMFQQVFSAWASVTSRQAALYDIAQLLGEAESNEQPILDDGKQESFAGFRAVRLESVAFAYDAKPVLCDVNLTINRGERIGILGETGSGKSTLVDIITGLLEPDSGRVTVDGQVLDADNRQFWRKQIAYMPQSVFLADTSVTENIAFAHDSVAIDAERVREVISIAQLADVVDALPDKASTLIGENGVRVSGGQRQRIGLARALYRQADLLVLDEATSALDTATEDRMMRALIAARPDMTMLIVAHRESNFAHCDRVIKVVDGNIEQVSH